MIGADVAIFEASDLVIREAADDGLRFVLQRSDDEEVDWIRVSVGHGVARWFQAWNQRRTAPWLLALYCI